LSSNSALSISPQAKRSAKISNADDDTSCFDVLAYPPSAPALGWHGRLANVPRCLIGMEACSGAPHIGRQLEAPGHDVRLMPAQYVKSFLKGHKTDYRDPEAIAEAVQRPTMHFVTIRTPEQIRTSSPRNPVHSVQEGGSF